MKNGEETKELLNEIDQKNAQISQLKDKMHCLEIVIERLDLKLEDERKHNRKLSESIIKLASQIKEQS